MQATSRESLGALRERFDEQAAGLESGALRSLSDELSAVVGLLSGQRLLRRHLADSSASESGRSELARSVLGDKISGQTLHAVTEAVTRRWSRPSDLLGGLELLGRQAMLMVAEQAGTSDEVEDELFRFGRVLESEPRLSELLGDQATSGERRVELLNSLLSGKVNDVTLRLVEQAVRVPRARSIDVVVGELAEVAASRRDRSVAVVTAAEPLSPEQEQRLVRVLSRIYQREVSIQVEIDPDVLGGLVVRLGDEVVDGSVAMRLAKASTDLPG